MWAIGVVLLIILFVVVLILRAPEGYEDECGFHYGKKEN